LIYRQHDFRTINELWVCFPDAYARVALMFDGRHLKKSKTIIKKGDLTPEFDETFAFDVPSQKLGSIYFRVSILHAGKTKEEHFCLCVDVPDGNYFHLKVFVTVENQRSPTYFRRGSCCSSSRY
jgi:hypothetical protein